MLKNIVVKLLVLFVFAIAKLLRLPWRDSSEGHDAQYAELRLGGLMVELAYYNAFEYRHLVFVWGTTRLHFSADYTKWLGWWGVRSTGENLPALPISGADVVAAGTPEEAQTDVPDYYRVVINYSLRGSYVRHHIFGTGSYFALCYIQNNINDFADCDEHVYASVRYQVWCGKHGWAACYDAACGKCIDAAYDARDDEMYERPSCGCASCDGTCERCDEKRRDEREERAERLAAERFGQTHDALPEQIVQSDNDEIPF